MATTNKAFIQFTSLSDASRVWFANATAWNEYWSTVYVNVNSADLSMATITTAGVIKAASKGTTYAQPTITAASMSISTDQNGDGIAETYTFPTLDYVTSLKNAFETLSVNYAALRTALESAGIIL